MNRRQHLSRERLYRYLSVSIALVTALLLAPPEWFGLSRMREQPKEPEARAVEIVRLSPETLPPPPPLPPRPEPVSRPKPESVPAPEEVVQLEPQLDVPDVFVPQQQQRRDAQSLKVARMKPDFATTMSEPQVAEAVPRRADTPRLELAARTERSYVDLSAPDVNVATERPNARPTRESALEPVSRQLKTGATVRNVQDAPDVQIPRGNTSRSGHSASMAVAGSVSGSRVVYDRKPGSAPATAVASPRSAAGSETQVLAADGGVAGVRYSTAPDSAPIGTASGRPSKGQAQLEDVRAALSRRYGLPLVSVNSLGQRSTEAARWNVLLPQISDLMKTARGLGPWRGGGSEEVVSVERDGDRLVIRYRDGVIHVLVPTRDGLTALFVARSADARAVVSKVEEAEQARGALFRYTRGAS